MVYMVRSFQVAKDVWTSESSSKETTWREHVVSFEKEATTQGGLAPLVPWSVRELIQAKHAHISAQNKVPMIDNPLGCMSCSNYSHYQMNCLMNLAIAVPLTLIWRVIRVALRTLFLPLTLVVASLLQNRYQLPPERNLVKEDLKSVGREYIDLFTTLYSAIGSLGNWIVPNLVPTDALEEFYCERIDDLKAFAEAYKTAEGAYSREYTAHYKFWHEQEAAKGS